MTAVATAFAPRQRLDAPIRCKPHRVWLATPPRVCIACGRPAEVGHHLLRHPTRRGLKGKACDSAMVSMCHRCHGLLHDAYGDEEQFFTEHGAPDYRAIADDLWAISPARKRSQP